MDSNNNNININTNDEDNIRAPDKVFCEKLIDDEENHINNYNLLHYNPQPNKPYNGLPKLKRHITNTWTIKKTDDNRFISVPLFKESDEDEEDITWLHDSIQNNSDNNDINMDDYNLEKAIQESFLQYNLENKNTELNCLESKDKEIEIIHPIEKKNILPIFKSKIQRLIYFEKGLKEIYELIKPIIELYENNELNYHETDNVTYDKIFNTLRSLRIPKEEWSILETIFVKKLNY